MNIIPDNQVAAEVLLPLTCHVAELRIISGICFTDKEIDTLACLLSGKTVKQLAPLLSIAPKTVNNHINNIKQKLKNEKCKNLIAFVEKSDKFSILKQHYANLLIRKSFRHILHNAFQLSARKTKRNCLIFYDREQKNHKKFASELQEDFISSGMEAIIEEFQKSKNILKLIQEEGKAARLDYIIVCVSVNMVKALQQGEHATSRKISNLIQIASIYTITPIYLSIEKNKDNLGVPQYIDASDYENYYSFVFELIGKMSPDFSMGENSLEFQKECERIAPLPSQSRMEANNEVVNKGTTVEGTVKINKNKKSLSKSKVLVSLVTVLTLLGLFFLSFNKNQNGGNIFLSNTKMQSLSQSNLYVNSELGKTETLYWNLPRQDHNFVGRADLLKELDRLLQEGQNFKQTTTLKDNPSKKLAIIPCAGIGGAGKTELALHYIRHSTHAYTLRAWFPSEKRAQLNEAYTAFANRLGYKNENPSIENVILYVKDWLAKHPGWLLVFDNVESYQEIAAFLPEQGGHIIITTRYRNWPEKFPILPVDVMLEVDAVALMESLTNPCQEEGEKKAVKKLVAQLGNLPLAIAQAGAYIKQNNIAVSEYLELYRHHSQELLKDGTLPEDTSSPPVANTWNISLASIAKEAQTDSDLALAPEVLTVCAYLNSEQISRKMLLTWLKETHPKLPSPQLTLNKILKKLHLYSLINFEGVEYVSIHRLVQTVLRNQHKQIKVNGKKSLYFPIITLEWYKNLLKNFYACFRVGMLNVDEEKYQIELLPHLQALVDHYQKLWPNERGPELAEMLQAIGYIYTYYAGNVKAAEVYLNQALVIKKKHYGDAHIETAKLLTYLGFMNGELGNLEEAKKQLENSLALKEQYYGKTHLEIASTLNSLAELYIYMGDPKKALEFANRALAVKKMYYPLNHRGLTENYSILGFVYTELAEYKTAKTYLEQALNIIEKYYGKDNYRVANIAHFLGFDCLYLGEYQRAKALCERAVKIRRDAFGINYFKISNPLLILGVVYQKLGYLKEGKALAEQAMSMRKLSYGENSPRIFAGAIFLSMTYLELNQLNEAKALLEKSSKFFESNLGKDHYGVGCCLQTLGEVYLRLGSLVEAKETLERALKIQKSFYNENNLLVAKTSLSLAKTYYALKEYKEALAIAEECSPIFTSHYTKDNKDRIDLSRLLERIKQVL